MAPRLEIPTLTKKAELAKKHSELDATPQEQPSQRKQPEVGNFRLKVDRQTKASYLTLEAAEKAGLAIKKGHPLVQVSVYDSVAGTNTMIEIPK
jgi:hypothetical protein